ncbi:hypothetical protein D7T58_19120 [Stenotrophomonas maltophilia]|nr:hypothetical protein [Stenotrophomonas maltophilia]MBA0470782.1 hypothetical protein [Stenotrophomonas maltophilia]MBA0478082.1 hypothetical protein [Stenotrophomonas maltophilia]MBA0487131.1 hypothetical protein [Stenotrophomonas maltophilia]
MLSDLLSQCQDEVRRLSGPVLTTLPIGAQHHLRQAFRDMADSARLLSDAAVHDVVLMGTTEVRCG